jgi:hypothetical protein
MRMGKVSMIIFLRGEVNVTVKLAYLKLTKLVARKCIVMLMRAALYFLKSPEGR